MTDTPPNAPEIRPLLREPTRKLIYHLAKSETPDAPENAVVTIAPDGSLGWLELTSAQSPATGGHDWFNGRCRKCDGAGMDVALSKRCKPEFYVLRAPGTEPKEPT